MTSNKHLAVLTSLQDYLLPKSMVQRLAKGVLPANTSISKDSLTAVLKSTSVFVNYLASKYVKLLTVELPFD